MLVDAADLSGDYPAQRHLDTNTGSRFDDGLHHSMTVREMLLS